MAMAMAMVMAVAVVMATVAAAMAMGAAAVARWGGDAARAVAAGGREVKGKKGEEGLGTWHTPIKSREEERQEEQSRAGLKKAAPVLKSLKPVGTQGKAPGTRNGETRNKRRRQRNQGGTSRRRKSSSPGRGAGAANGTARRRPEAAACTRQRSIHTMPRMGRAERKAAQGE